MPDAALTRTGLALLKNDGSDSTTIYRGNIRAIGALLEASGLIGVEGLDSARPAAGTHLRFYKPTDVLGVIYWDNGGTWETIGGSAATDAAAGVGSLRTLGSGPLQAAAGNHGHARDIFDYATPGIEVPSLTGTPVSLASTSGTLVSGPSSGRRIVKSLAINAPTAGMVVTLALAGVTVARLGFSTAGVVEAGVTWPIANGETLSATVTGGTARFFPAYGDRADTAVDRFGLVNSSGSGTLVASTGSARTISQVWVCNPSSSATATVTLTIAGTDLCTTLTVPASGVVSWDAPKSLPASGTVTYAGDGVTACTFLVVGH